MKLTLLNVGAAPFSFTQRKLLDADEFGRAAGDRGHRLYDGDLERLHRARILVPAFALVRPRWDISRRVAGHGDAYAPGQRSWSVPKDGSSLKEDLAAGLVRDAWHLRFRPWKTERVPTPHGSVGRREYLYSQYQLADLSLAVAAMPILRQAVGDRSSWDRLEIRALRRAAIDRRDSIAMLEALEPRYLPDIMARYRFTRSEGEEERESYLESYSASDLLHACGWDPAQLYALGTRLIVEAGRIDPLRDWLDLVRHVHPDRWPKLRGDALQAVELRCAAEMVYRFLEDLQALDLAPPFPEVPTRFSHELNERIRRDRGELDRVLMAFGLSPHPAVVLALEGPTEMTIAPLVMGELGIPQRPSFIRLVDSGGETRDHGFLAQYVTLPSLGPREGRVASYERPPTRYLVAVDGDREFRDLMQREAKRSGIVELLWRSLPPDYRSTAALKELDDLVEIEVWAEGLDFERAHFSDGELVSGLFSMGLVPRGTTEQALASLLADARAAGRPLESVWTSWPVRPTKPELAMKLWPYLQNRLAGAGGDRTLLAAIPIARTLVHAFDLAARTPRRHVVFRLDESET